MENERNEEQEIDYEDLVCAIADQHNVDFLKAEDILDQILIDSYQDTYIAGYHVSYCKSLRDYFKS
jgi:hypothetical protein